MKPVKIKYSFHQIIYRLVQVHGPGVVSESLFYSVQIRGDLRSWYIYMYFYVLSTGTAKHEEVNQAPLTGPDGPCGDDPQRDGEDQEHSARTDGHEGFHHKARVEVNLVECPDAAGRGVREELAVEQHDPGDKVQPQEHGYGQDDVHVRVRLGRHVRVGQPRCPGEGVVSWNWVDGTHQDLQADEEDAFVRHGYPPVIGRVVHHK